MARGSARLVDHLSEEMRTAGAVPVQTVSEVLLTVEEESLTRLSQALASARFVVGSKRELVPFDPDAYAPYIIARRRGSWGPPMRADMLSDLKKRYAKEDLEAWVWA